MIKQISLNANDNAYNYTTNIMNKYNMTRTQALNYICNTHEEHDKNLNSWYRDKILTFTLDLTNGRNVAKKTGNFKRMDEVLEEFKCLML